MSALKIYCYQRVVQAKLFMDRHFGDPIDLRQIADEAYFSRFHFIRLFKTIYGKTPHQYLKWVRLEQAKKLLTENGSIADVCFTVGFDSIGSFSSLFKKEVGMSPALFRQQQQKRRERLRAFPLHFIPGCFAAQHGWTKNSNYEEAV